MRVLFCGGGTAGHVSPAIAMAEILIKKYRKCEIAFVGRKGGYENNAILSKGFKLFEIELNPPKFYLSAKGIKNLTLLLGSFKEAEEIIDDFKPNIIIGTGSYVCFPVIYKGIKKEIPTLLHESNEQPGRVTKILGKKCTKILLNYDETKKYLSKYKNLSTIGNPIDESFFLQNKEKNRQRLNIKSSELLVVSFGGSGGAERINETILNLMNMSSYRKMNITHIHACGTKYFNDIVKNNPDIIKNKKFTILPYIHNMPELMSAADLTITRSGSATISELATLGKNTILIPSPNVTNNHQYKNAKILVDYGATTMLEERDLNEQTLYKTIIDANKKRKELENKIQIFGSKNVAEYFIKNIEEIRQLRHKKTSKSD